MAYEWKKTAGKFLIIAGEVVVSGLIVYFTDNSLFLAAIPLLEAGRNWLKHRNK